MKKAVEADELARFVKADQVAHPTEQRKFGDAVVSAHHPVAAHEPFFEDTEQPLIRSRSPHMSGGLSHCRPLVIVDNVPPESIRAAAHDIACRASKVNILAVGTFAIN